MYSLRIIFHDCRAAELEPLIKELIEEGGALGRPGVSASFQEVHLLMDFPDHISVLLVTRFVQDWVKRQNTSFQYVGLREA